jgi:hypothetical protein
VCSFLVVGLHPIIIGILGSYEWGSVISAEVSGGAAAKRRSKMTQENNTKTKSIFDVTFVNDDYFIGRVRAFEKMYGMDWNEFLAKYSDGSLTDGQHNEDYAEWAFLCHSFMSELLRHDTGPPENPTDSEPLKPELSSGFLVLRESSDCSTRNPTSTMSATYWQPLKGVSVLDRILYCRTHLPGLGGTFRWMPESSSRLGTR